MSTDNLKHMVHLYEEVYVVGVDHTVTPLGELEIFDQYERLLSHLRTKNIRSATPRGFALAAFEANSKQ